MTSHDRTHDAAFETVEDELKHLRESYAELEKKNKELERKYEAVTYKYNQLKSCHNCSEGNESEEPSAKQQELDDNSTDPLVRLDEPIANKIMKYLSPTELLQATEVSSGWKHFIESRKSLMDPAMRKIIFKPSLEGCSLQLASSLFNEHANRAYQEMECPLYLDKTFKICPIQQYATSLIDLEITNTNKDQSVDAIEGCEFPNLESLRIYGYSISIILDCSFPSLEFLSIRNEDCETMEDWMTDINAMKMILNKFPTLYDLHIFPSTNTVFFEMCGIQEDPVNLKVETDIEQPEIEILLIGWYYAELMKYQQDSLKDLYVKVTKIKHLSWLLRDLKVLKYLNISCIWCCGENADEEVNFPQNTSIEYLKIGFVINVDHLDTAHENIPKLLLAVPSLKELILSKITTAEIIRFIASNMTKLEKLVCDEIDEATMQAYREVQSNPHRYVNSSFELVQDPEYTFGLDF